MNLATFAAMKKKKVDEASLYQLRFGRRLRISREDGGYETYSAFADRLGLQHETYRLYEAGARTPKMHVLAQIADELSVSLDYLIRGKTSPGRGR